ALPPVGQRGLPAEPLAAPWGWRTAVRELRRLADPVTPQSIVDDVLLPSFRAGADLLDLQLGESTRGYPLPWLPRDPLRRPEHWRGGTFWPEWNGAAIARVCREAHLRGMLVQTFLAPEPCPGGSLQENFAGVRFL